MPPHVRQAKGYKVGHKGKILMLRPGILDFHYEDGTHLLADETVDCPPNLCQLKSRREVADWRSP